MKKIPDVKQKSKDEKIKILKAELKRKNELIERMREEKDMIMKLLYKAQNSNIATKKALEQADDGK